MSNTKQRIIEAFRAQLERVGYHRTTLDDIASELHISKKTIYVHFDSKDEIYRAIVDERADQEKLKLAAAIATLPTYVERIEAVIGSILEYSRAHIGETSLEEWMEEYEIAADAFRQANGELLRELIEAGMDADEFACGDVVFVERMVAAMVLDYVVMVREDPSKDYDGELVERIIRFLT
jgi:AcrR family transcriptional regulator